MVLDETTDGAKRLILVLCLPLVDGVFATLLVTGTLQTFSDVIAVALTVFTGAGALAILYSYAETRAEARQMVRTAAPFLFLGAAAIALVAPVFEQLFYVHRLQYAAGLALLVIAAQLLEVSVAKKFSTPGIILTGFLLSLRNPDALSLSLTYLGPAVVTATVAIAGLYAATYVRADRLSLGYVRRGGGIAVLTIALSQFGVQIPSELGIAAFAGALLIAYHR